MLSSLPVNKVLRRLQVALCGCFLLALTAALPVAAQIPITTQETLAGSSADRGYATGLLLRF